MTRKTPVDPVQAAKWYRWPRALVFRAFTEPSLLERWFCPNPEMVLRVDALDLRVGGRYRFVYHGGAGAIAVIGEYIKIEAERELIFTWTWEPPDPHAGIKTLVHVTFSARDGGTEVSVTHERFPTDESMQRHRNGWQLTLDRLERDIWEIQS